MSKFYASIFTFVLAVCAMVIFQFSWALLLVFVLCMATFLFVMALCIRCNFYVKSIQSSSPKNVLLTFDDGPDPELTPKVLAILKKHNAQAAFFLIGHKVKGNENLVRQIAAEGHLVGSHSFAHSAKMSASSTEKVKVEIAKGHQQIADILPENPQLFRPPFGVTNPKIAAALKLLNLQSMGWNVRSFDTFFKEPEKLKKRMLQKIDGGNIVLLHDTQPHTVAILDELISAIKHKNLTLKAEYE